MKIEELEKKVKELDFMVCCITIHKTARHSWIKPMMFDKSGRLMDVTVNALAERIGLKAEWVGPKAWETRCIKVPHWDKYSFDGYVLTHLILACMYPGFDDRYMDVREFCRD